MFEEAGAALDAFEPERRLESGALGALHPAAPPEQQRWHTYPPVPVRSATATAAALHEPRRWTDYGSAIGQFTAVRPGGLLGQTFEIEIVVPVGPRAPALSRAYVTCTRAFEQGAELQAWTRQLNERLAAIGSEPAAVPDGAEALAGIELTTHVGHFMGAATSNLLLFEEGGQAYLRDVGCWDPMPPHLEIAYRTRGAAAQRAFWGDGDPDDSMLHRFAAADDGPADL